MLDPQSIPVDEDSPDLTDEEIAEAVQTVDCNDFVRAVEKGVRSYVKSTLTGTAHELRKRKPHLYCRTRMAIDGEPDKVLLFQVDWLFPKS